VVAIDVATRAVHTAFRLDLPYWNVADATMLALRGDGRELAVGNGEEVVRLDLADHRVVARRKSVTAAVGYSPAGVLRILG
jgi:hypothetical protein